MITIANDQLSLEFNGTMLTFFEAKKEKKRCKSCWLIPFGRCDQIPCTEQERNDGKRGFFSIREMPNVMDNVMEFKIVCKSHNRVKEINFRSQKSLYQWERRNGHLYVTTPNRSLVRYLKKDYSQEWEQFLTISNKIITLSELEEMAQKLKNDALKLQQA